jgi:uncharacterized membrane protein YqjE
MTSTSNLADAAKASRSIARRIMAIAQNRLELFCLEVREERERAERAVFMVFGAGISLLLAGVAITLLVVFLLDDAARLWALGILASALGISGVLFLIGLANLRRDWKTLEETRSQLRQDREEIDRLLG